MLTNRARDIHKCLKCISSFSDNQAEVTSWDAEYLEWIVIKISPKDGPYHGGRYEFKVVFGKKYPRQAPQVDCITPIYHPNIDMTDDYNVCLSLLDEWDYSFGLEDIIQGLLFLLYNPNLSDPLSPWFEPSMSEAEFHENLQKTLQGQDIEDAINFHFPKMIGTLDMDIKHKSYEGSPKIITGSNFKCSETGDHGCKQAHQPVEKINTANQNINCVQTIIKSEQETKHDSIDTNKSIDNNLLNIDTQIQCYSTEQCDSQQTKPPETCSDTVISDSNKECDTCKTAPCKTDPESIANYIEEYFLTGSHDLMMIDMCDEDSDLSEGEMDVQDTHGVTTTLQRMFSDISLSMMQEEQQFVTEGIQKVLSNDVPSLKSLCYTAAQHHGIFSAGVSENGSEFDEDDFYTIGHGAYSDDDSWEDYDGSEFDLDSEWDAKSELSDLGQDKSFDICYSNDLVGYVLFGVISSLLLYKINKFMSFSK